MDHGWIKTRSMRNTKGGEIEGHGVRNPAFSRVAFKVDVTVFTVMNHWKDKFLYIVKIFCSLSQLSKQYDSRREFHFKEFRFPFPLNVSGIPPKTDYTKTDCILWNHFHSKCYILYTYLFISMFETKSVNYLYIFGIFRFCPTSINTPRHLTNTNTTRRSDRLQCHMLPMKSIIFKDLNTFLWKCTQDLLKVSRNGSVLGFRVNRHDTKLFRHLHTYLPAGIEIVIERYRDRSTQKIYMTMNWEVNRKHTHIYECRCDERLKAKTCPGNHNDPHTDWTSHTRPRVPRTVCWTRVSSPRCPDPVQICPWWRPHHGPHSTSPTTSIPGPWTCASSSPSPSRPVDPFLQGL